MRTLIDELEENMEKDISFEFWEKFDKADYLEKEEIINPIVDRALNMYEIWKSHEVKEEHIRHMLKTLFMDYFTDLLDYAYTAQEGNTDEEK